MTSCSSNPIALAGTSVLATQPAPLERGRRYPRSCCREGTTRQAVYRHSGVLPQLRILWSAVKQYEIGIRQCCRHGWTFGYKNRGITERGDLYRLRPGWGVSPTLTPTRGPHGQTSGTDYQGPPDGVLRYGHGREVRCARLTLRTTFFDRRGLQHPCFTSVEALEDDK